MSIVNPTDELLHTHLLIRPSPPPSDTVPDTVDYKNRPAVRAKQGRWRAAAFMIGVEMAERMTYLGISSNLISFLTQELGQPTAMAAANVNAWAGMINLLPILGAVVADSFLGQYLTVVIASLLYILGLCLLTLSAVLPSLGCTTEGTLVKDARGCLPNLRTIIFFIALYMVAIGEGGHRPSVQAFGAGQFDEEDPRESKSKSSFFNWWYCGTCSGCVIGVIVLSYVQDNLSWGLGFGIPCVIMLMALLIFLIGTVTYRFNVKRDGESPVMRLGRVFVTAARNWNANPSVLDDDEEASGKPLHRASQQFRFLDKALCAPKNSEASIRGCSRSEVKEAKAVLRLFPIWATTLVFAIVNAQTGTFFTKQGATLDRSVGASFVIPAAALNALPSICTALFLPIYDRVLVPVARNMTGRVAGISTLQRIGTGLFISIFSMAVAAVIEKKRLEIAAQHGLIDMPNVTVPMSIFWLVPQYALFGIAEAFTMVGQQEFFYDQAPSELPSVGLSIYLSVYGIGNLLSGFMVSTINVVTSRSEGESWLSNNLNRAHLDYFYWLLAALSAIGLALFIYFAKSYIYKSKKV